MLTKSIYMNGVQCPKYMWIAANSKQLIPPQDAASQMRIEQGHLIGKYAQSLYPNGVHVRDIDPEKNARVTSKLLEQRVPLFEAGFIADGMFSRADILVPVENNEWDIIEVKSSASVKEEHLIDVAFQKYCCAKAGIKICKSFLMHIDTSYVRDGDVETAKLLKSEDVSSLLELERAESTTRSFITMLSSGCPSTPVGLQCHSPRDCPLIYHCWKDIPADNVFCLHRDTKHIATQLYSSGIVRIIDIPPDVMLSDAQNIQRVCANIGKAHIEKGWIRKFISSLSHPTHYLDFESFDTAIPMLDKTHPYQHVPFQFSLHIDDGKGLVHKGFLADGSGDPRPGFIAALKKEISAQGSIVVYHRSFEASVLKALATDYPEHAKFIDSVISRIVDLELVFNGFHYYSGEQHGSTSIKHVLPAITGVSYDSLEGIKNGNSASLAFMKLADNATPDAEKQEIKNQLEKYCGLDTEGMALIINKLREQTGIER